MVETNIKEQASSNLEVIIERIANLREENAKEHATILAQTTKTNGTVADLVKWRYLITGALIIMNIVLVPIIIAVSIKFITTNIW
jgi:hypothetical protein